MPPPALSRLLSLASVSAIAHRGGAALRPENTLTAFAHAVALGVDAIECDVHVSRDGEVVVIHDDTLDRTTDATGPVSALTAAELDRVDAGYRFEVDGTRPWRDQGVGVPRLETVLGRWPNLPFVVEIKGGRPDDAVRVLEAIGRASAIDRVIVGGFSHPVLVEVRRRRPDLVTSASVVEARAALRRSYLWMTPRPAGFQLFQVPLRLRGRQVLSRRFVRTARRAGLPVQAWVVNDVDVMQQLVGWGVTGLISDRPDTAVALARQHAAAVTGPTPGPAAGRAPGVPPR